MIVTIDRDVAGNPAPGQEKRKQKQGSGAGNPALSGAEAAKVAARLGATA